MDFDNKNRGVLFENDKQDNPKRPDFSGTIDVEGKEYRLAMWEKVSKKGQAFFSLAVSEKKEVTDTQGKGRSSEAWNQAREKLHKEEPEQEAINLDDIPFNENH